MNSVINKLNVTLILLLLLRCAQDVSHFTHSELKDCEFGRCENQNQNRKALQYSSSDGSDQRAQRL